MNESQRDQIERNLQYNYGVDTSEAPNETHAKQDLIGHANALRDGLQTAKTDIILLLEERDRLIEINRHKEIRLQAAIDARANDLLATNGG